VAEQLSLLERPEVAADGMATALLLPDDLPELRVWIDEAVAREYPNGLRWGEATIWPHAWVLRDLVAALPDPGTYARLVEDRKSGRPVHARQVHDLVAAVSRVVERG